MEREKEMSPIGMGIDPHAVLYKYENKIIRAIKPKYEDFYSELITNKIIRELISGNTLIQTERSLVSLDGHNLILEHPLIDVISYPFEWTPSMFKDASMTILRLNITLMRYGLCTQDAHPWNVLFDGNNPKFIDFTSIIKLPPNGNWVAIEEFNYYCLNTLLLMSRGYPTTARSLLREIFCYPDKKFINSLGKDKLDYQKNIFSSRSNNFFRKTFNKVRQKLGFSISTSVSVSGLNEVENLLRKIDGLDVKPPQSEWSNYYSGENELPIYDGTRESLSFVKNSTPKHSIINQILLKIEPKTVLDIGCNSGLYSQLAASNGSKVVGIDLDEQALDRMYHDSKKLDSNAIPLFINSVAPAEAIGFKEIPFPSVTERLKSDCVICLALVHHLVFKRTHMSFNHIAKVLSSYSKKFLIVEFIPKEDNYVKNWYSDEFDWYNCENFKDSLYDYYSLIEVFESFPSPRIILFCQK